MVDETNCHPQEGQQEISDTHPWNVTFDPGIEMGACREGLHAQAVEESRSHVVEALRGEEWRARNTLRISLGRGTTKADIDYTIKSLSEILTKLKKWYN